MAKFYLSFSETKGLFNLYVISFGMADYRNSYTDQEILAERHGMTVYEYRQTRYAERQRRPLNMMFGRIIRARLAYLRKTTAWLASEVGVSRLMASFYVDGTSLPKPERAAKIFRALRLERFSLEDLLQKNNHRAIS